MKNKVGPAKLRGGYYTPEPITQFICDWAISPSTQNILEPSCGDGAFIRQAVKKTAADKIIGVELYDGEAKKASLYGTNMVCGDFYDYILFYTENFNIIKIILQTNKNMMRS